MSFKNVQAYLSAMTQARSQQNSEKVKMARATVEELTGCKMDGVTIVDVDLMDGKTICTLQIPGHYDIEFHKYIASDTPQFYVNGTRFDTLGFALVCANRTKPLINPVFTGQEKYVPVDTFNTVAEAENQELLLRKIWCRTIVNKIAETTGYSLTDARINLTSIRQTRMFINLTGYRVIRAMYDLPTATVQYYVGRHITRFKTLEEVLVNAKLPTNKGLLARMFGWW